MPSSEKNWKGPAEVPAAGEGPAVCPLPVAAEPAPAHALEAAGSVGAVGVVAAYEQTERAFVDVSAGEGYISSERIAKAIRKARRDNKVKAIVFLLQ